MESLYEGHPDMPHTMQLREQNDQSTLHALWNAPFFHWQYVPEDNLAFSMLAKSCVWLG